MPDCSKGLKSHNEPDNNKEKNVPKKTNQCRHCDMLAARYIRTGVAMKKVNKELRNTRREVLNKRDIYYRVLLRVYNLCHEPQFINQNPDLVGVLKRAVKKYHKELDEFLPGLPKLGDDDD